MIERRVITGLIISTDFIQQLHGKWDASLLESNTAKRIASWCLEYFDKYDKAPGKEIGSIFDQKIRNGLPKNLIADIEDILDSLSKDYEKESINVPYLVDESIAYFNERHLRKHTERINGMVEAGQLLEAQKEALSFKPISKESGNWIDLSNPSVLDNIDRAFTSSTECLIHFPGPLGTFWNDQLVRDGFVAIMSCEKRGKSFLLLEFAIRAAKQKRKVAFFQAGDMTEGQQLKRIAIRLAKKSNLEKYSGKMLEPVCDCIFNQTGKCDRKERRGDYGIFEKMNEEQIRREITMNELKEAYENNPDYTPCSVCKEYSSNCWGTPWVKEINTGHPLSSNEAKKAIEKFFIKYNRQFKLSTHPNGTLTIRQAKTILDIWKKEDGFMPDVIIFDYPDIMDDETVKEFRHKQNKIWMDGRGLSQERHALVIWVTQTDANAYTKNLVRMENFSEDKRKYAHPTAFYALNQDTSGREKALGIMRINEIVIREGEFDSNHQVHVLQNLKRGLPFLSSYW
jgi:hypothetical protein